MSFANLLFFIHSIILLSGRQDLTALYNMLFSDVYPAFLRQADGDVIAVRDPPPLTPQRERASRLVRSRTINTVMDGDIPSEIDSLYALCCGFGVLGSIC